MTQPIWAEALLRAALVLFALATGCGVRIEVKASKDGPPPCPARRGYQERPPAAACGGFDLAAWLRENPLAQDEVRTGQSGLREPAPLVAPGQDVPAAVAAFRAAWAQVLGPIPRLGSGPGGDDASGLGLCREAPRLSPAQERAFLAEPFTLERVTYLGAHGAPIPAYLLLPRASRGAAPAVIVAHQALFECGKDESVGLCPEGAWNLDLARTLARRGLVVLVPDTVGYGERAACSFHTGNEYADAAPLLRGLSSHGAGVTLMGLRISDMGRAVDLLRGLPQVDGERIGIVGHSNGGIEALFTAAFDPRIRCAVSNAGPNLIRREIQSGFGLSPGIDRWAGFGYLPALARHDGDVAALPVEMHQLYALVAPRGLFISLMEDDSVAPRYDRIDFTLDQARAAHGLLGGDFAAHTIESGQTPACREEFGVPLCLAHGYDECARRGDGACIAGYAAHGLTRRCIEENGNAALGCAHFLYVEQCQRAEGRGAAECRARFAPLGVTDACIDAAVDRGCRRDHGWYPETEERAWPWLDACLRR